VITERIQLPQAGQSVNLWNLARRPRNSHLEIDEQKARCLECSRIPQLEYSNAPVNTLRADACRTFVHSSSSTKESSTLPSEGLAIRNTTALRKSTKRSDCSVSAKCSGSNADISRCAALDEAPPIPSRTFVDTKLLLKPIFPVFRPDTTRLPTRTIRRGAA
jgi:hypothetical protein